MQKVFYSVLFSFAVALFGNGALADNNKVDLGDGRVFEKALSGERVRVQVDFIIPAAEIPEGADGFEIRRGMIKSTRSSLLQQVFDEELAGISTDAIGPQLVRKLDNVPSMAMVLTLEEMEKLAANPSVSRIYPDAISKVNLAFFTTNGIASVVFALFVMLDLML